MKVTKGRKRKVESMETSSPGAGSQYVVISCEKTLQSARKLTACRVDAIVSGIRKKLKSESLSPSSYWNPNVRFT